MFTIYETYNCPRNILKLAVSYQLFILQQTWNGIIYK